MHSSTNMWWDNCGHTHSAHTPIYKAAAIFTMLFVLIRFTACSFVCSFMHIDTHSTRSYVLWAEVSLFFNCVAFETERRTVGTRMHVCKCVCFGVSQHFPLPRVQYTQSSLIQPSPLWWVVVLRFSFKFFNISPYYSDCVRLSFSPLLTFLLCNSITCTKQITNIGVGVQCERAYFYILWKHTLFPKHTHTTPFECAYTGEKKTTKSYQQKNMHTRYLQLANRTPHIAPHVYRIRMHSCNQNRDKRIERMNEWINTNLAKPNQTKPK